MDHSVLTYEMGMSPHPTFLPKEGVQEVMQGKSLHQTSVTMFVMLNQTL